MKVTVVCVTYNHARYIEQALDSFLMQKTQFPYQVFVADDCSNDGTREILINYSKRYPDIVKLFLPAENQGAEKNLIHMCQSAKTPYIALCDGDDYWTDSEKLQKQYDYMEMHPEMRACFHDTRIVVENNEKWFLSRDYSHTPDGTLRWSSGHKKFFVKNEYTIADYIDCGFVHSSSMFFRWDDTIEIPDWYFDHILGDYSLWCIQVGLGTFGYLDAVMSVYRRHCQGSYNFKSREESWGATRPDWIQIDEDLKGYFQALGASDELLSQFDVRQANDVGRLLKYAFRDCSESQRDDLLLEYSTLIEKHSGIPMKLDGNNRPTHDYVRNVDKYFGCTPPLLSRTSLRRMFHKL